MFLFLTTLCSLLIPLFPPPALNFLFCVVTLCWLHFSSLACQFKRTVALSHGGKRQVPQLLISAHLRMCVDRQGSTLKAMGTATD